MDVGTRYALPAREIRNYSKLMEGTAAGPSKIIRARISVAEILEICRDAKVAATDELNHRLQVVSLFSGDANLSILQLALHFETLRLDGLNNFLGFISFEPLLNFQFLPGVSDG